MKHLVILSSCHLVTRSAPAGGHERKAHDSVLHELGLVGAIGELGVERANDQPVRIDALPGQELLHAKRARLGERTNVLGREATLWPWPGSAALDLEVQPR